jgi:hypothetical protein
MLRSSGTVLLPEFLPPELLREPSAEEESDLMAAALDDGD